MKYNQLLKDQNLTITFVPLKAEIYLPLILLTSLLHYKHQQ